MCNLQILAKNEMIFGNTKSKANTKQSSQKCRIWRRKNNLKSRSINTIRATQGNKYDTIFLGSK